MFPQALGLLGKTTLINTYGESEKVSSLLPTRESVFCTCYIFY